MRNTSVSHGVLNFRIPSYQGGGKDTQYRTIWERYNQKDQSNGVDEWYCVTCGDRLVQREKATQDGHAHRELHHLIKQRYFPSSFQIDRECFKDVRAQQSRNHPSNVIPLCRACHLGLWEDWESGRPHIMAWLFKDITGDEIDLALWPEHSLRDEQRTTWSSAEAVAMRRQGRKCSACNHVQEKDVTKRLYLDGEIKHSYTGRDVRAVHVIPPTTVPQLTHVPRNLVLLCWECLFGEASVPHHSDTDAPIGWKDEQLIDWTVELAPHLYLEYRDLVA